jgi:hypothetical protein
MTTQQYKDWREKIESKFAEKTLVEESLETHVSPSGEFVLEVLVYSSGSNTWDYSRGIIRRRSDQTVIADVKRNYGMFWHAWVSHKNGNEYLLCGEDYQDYNVIELSSGRNHVYFPDEAFNGGGFCWVVVHPSPDGLTLAVDGCYWGCPYELVFFDFTNPMSIPLQELARIDEFEDTVGWDTASSFAYLGNESDKQPRVWKRGSV